MANYIFKVQINLPEGNETFIRRLGAVDNCFDKFNENLLQRYSIFKTNSFKITWVDAEDDVIRVVNAEDFLIFSELKGKKLYVAIDSLCDERYGDHGVKNTEKIKGGDDVNLDVGPENASQLNVNELNVCEKNGKKSFVVDPPTFFLYKRYMRFTFKENDKNPKNLDLHPTSINLTIMKPQLLESIDPDEIIPTFVPEALATTNINTSTSLAKNIEKGLLNPMASSKLKTTTKKYIKKLAMDTDQLSSVLSTLSIAPKLPTQKSRKKLTKCPECGFYKINSANVSSVKLSTVPFEHRCTKCGGLKRREEKENANTTIRHGPMTPETKTSNSSLELLAEITSSGPLATDYANRRSSAFAATDAYKQIADGLRTASSIQPPAYVPTDISVPKTVSIPKAFNSSRKTVSSTIIPSTVTISTPATISTPPTISTTATISSAVTIPTPATISSAAIIPSSTVVPLRATIPSSATVPSSGTIPSIATVTSSTIILSSESSPLSIIQSSSNTIPNGKDASLTKYYSVESFRKSRSIRLPSLSTAGETQEKLLSSEIKDNWWKDYKVNGDGRLSETSKNVNDGTKSMGAIPKRVAFREWSVKIPNPKNPVHHPNPKINEAITTMIAMGFDNDENWLTRLLESVDGDIVDALELLHPTKNIN